MTPTPSSGIPFATSWEDYFRDNEAGSTSRPVDSLLFRTGGVPPTRGLLTTARASWSTT